MIEIPNAIIVMKVRPHSNMRLKDIIESKHEEELRHGVHYWGYSGVFCQPKPTQLFCNWAKKNYGEDPSLILIETKSAYSSNIGYIKQYSSDNKVYVPFKAPVQLQGAKFSFVANNLRVMDSFNLEAYNVYGGKNDGKILTEHLRFRVNKSFAILNKDAHVNEDNSIKANVLIATLIEPYAIWLKE